MNIAGAMNKHKIGSNPSGLAHESGHCDTPQEIGEPPSNGAGWAHHHPVRLPVSPLGQGAPITTALTHQEPALS